MDLPAKIESDSTSRVSLAVPGAVLTLQSVQCDPAPAPCDPVPCVPQAGGEAASADVVLPSCLGLAPRELPAAGSAFTLYFDGLGLSDFAGDALQDLFTCTITSSSSGGNTAVARGGVVQDPNGVNGFKLAFLFGSWTSGPGEATVAVALGTPTGEVPVPWKGRADGSTVTFVRHVLNVEVESDNEITLGVKGVASTTPLNCLIAVTGSPPIRGPEV